ncbi:Tn3 family transposase [Streptosporangium sp. CA-135522]|uniref:Tn3 family transposase n=1 Tax=Streptosporangium sp. CA-135522 TaxID=3240072 RepID=UPI003D8A4D63
MIEGLLRHRTDAETESNYVDTHGTSVAGFVFTELLNFRLLPRLQNIGSIRLCRPDDAPPGRPALDGSLTRAIRWELIAQQYDQMVKADETREILSEQLLTRPEHAGSRAEAGCLPVPEAHVLEVEEPPEQPVAPRTILTPPAKAVCARPMKRTAPGSVRGSATVRPVVGRCGSGRRVFGRGVRGVRLGRGSPPRHRV